MNITQKSLQKYAALEDMLEKKSSSKFLGIGLYKDRYFKFLQNGKFLVYYKDKPEEEDELPQAYLDVTQM